MATIERFEDLNCWQEAQKFCQRLYVAILSNDNIMDYPLKNQLNSSSGSIMDNIAEGFSRNGNKEFRQFLTIAKGSCSESRSQLHRALDRDYISNELFSELSEQSISIEKMISGLIKYINKSDYKGSKFKEGVATYNIELRT